MAARQPILDPSLIQGVGQSWAGEIEHGEVFTRQWVVDLILHLVGYDASKDLSGTVLVEPACGAGAFLGPVVSRLSASCARHGRSLTDASDAIRAFDLVPRNVEQSRSLVQAILVKGGWTSSAAGKAARTWVREADYLLIDHEDDDVDFVVGNPPYIRLEDVPVDRMEAYRSVCATMTGRSDVYIGFYEMGLRSLRQGGVLGFICADRWMRNQYGKHLRQLISEAYSVEAAIIMHDVDAFDEQVSAYPAITVVRRDPQDSAIIADTTKDFGEPDVPAVMSWARDESAGAISCSHFNAARLPGWFSGQDSWPTGSPTRLALIEHLNERFAPLEEKRTGTRVGIGVATGADGIFLATTADVEHDRMLPLSMVRDIASGHLKWSGTHLVNPWDESGQLVNLDDYPRLRRYFERNGAALRRRHVAGKRASAWYRTIDKVDAKLTARQKLLIPDMKTSLFPVFDDGGYYPHHNLYYVVSDSWDLKVLGGLLMSRVAQAFVEAYAVRMRGGTLRFQAQYLRKIRVPHPDSLTPDDKSQLISSFLARDVDLATKVAVRLYRAEDFVDALSGH